MKVELYQYLLKSPPCNQLYYYTTIFGIDCKQNILEISEPLNSLPYATIFAWPKVKEIDLQIFSRPIDLASQML